MAIHAVRGLNIMPLDQSLLEAASRRASLQIAPSGSRNSRISAGARQDGEFRTVLPGRVNGKVEVKAISLDMYTYLTYNYVSNRRTNVFRRCAMPTAKSDSRLNFRLSSEQKKTIEDAAAETGRTVSDFAVSTLVDAARRILREQEATRLSDRDRQLFVEMLDNESTRPNEALVKAAKRYKKQVG